MEKSDRGMQSADCGRLLLKQLRHEQESVPENSKEFIVIQNKINQIVAQNLLEYVNR